MLKTIIRTALRVFWKERGYSFLNILGLTVGISGSLMLMLYIQDEYGIDKFHEKSDRIYQVMEHQTYSGNNIFTTNANPGPLKDAFKQEMPEVEHIVQVSWEQERLFIVGDKTFKESGRMASEDFFKNFLFSICRRRHRKFISSARCGLHFRKISHKNLWRYTSIG